MTGKDDTISELEKELAAAWKISVPELAARIEEIGFCCLRCGECCVGDENSVVAFPFEIRSISRLTGDEWLETVAPPTIGEWDSSGCFHTLEWRLKKTAGKCKYYSESGCRIYQVRPLLCSTYPFYLVRGRLFTSECRGLGKAISSIEAARLADLLKKRYVVELQESLSLLRKYREFERGRPVSKGDCIVHDSEGEHRICGIQLVDLAPDSSEG